MPVLAVPSEAICSYRGYNFGPYTVTDGIKGKFLKDPTGRVVTATEYTFSFTTTVAATTSTIDAELTTIRQTLSKPGGVFIYHGRGLGNIDINTGRLKDVAWGPVPEVLDVKPWSASRYPQAAQVKWSLTVTIPECGDAAFEGIMAFNFGVTYDVKDGLTTRTIAGRLKIAANRATPNSRDMGDVADRYRSQLAPPEIIGFRRSYGPAVLNEAKDELSFTIIDTQMSQNIPPEGVIEATASHTHSSSVAGLGMWSGTLDASYTLARGTDPSVALGAFLKLAKERLVFTGSVIDGVVNNGAGSIIPLAFSFGNPNLYSENPKVNVSLSYSFVCPLANVFGASPLWHPVPGSDWKRWTYSMAKAGVTHPRGYAQLEFEVGDDRLIDLCDSAPAIQLGNATTVGPQAQPYGPSAFNSYRSKAQSPGFTSSVKTAFPDPQPDASWMWYQTGLYIESADGTISVATLPQALLDGTADIFGKYHDLAGQAWDVLQKQFPATSKSQPGTQRIPATAGDVSSSRRVRPVVFVYLIGSAARAKFRVPIPRLVKVNGVEAIPANRLDHGEGFYNGIQFTAANKVAVHTGWWRLRYALKSHPTGVLPIPPNPILGESGN